MIQTGDKIRNKKTNTIHIVDSIDSFDGITLIFTKDVKYIPIDDVEFIPKSIISEYFIKLFRGEKLDYIEESNLTDKLRDLKPVTILPVDPNFFKDR